MVYVKPGLRKRLEMLERACPEPVTLESLIAFDEQGNIVPLTNQRVPLALLDELVEKCDLLAAGTHANVTVP